MSPVSSSQGWGGVGGVIFCFSSLCSMCSHHVPLRFPSCSLRRSQKHLNFIPYGLPKVQLSCIETEKAYGLNPLQFVPLHLNSSSEEFHPQFCICLTCPFTAGWLAGLCSSWNQTLSEWDLVNLLNWYTVSQNGPQFCSLYNCTQLGMKEGLEGQTRAQ